MIYNRALARAAVLALFVLAGAAGVDARSVAPSLRLEKGTDVRVVPSPLSGSLNTYQRARARDLLAGQAAIVDTLRIVGIQVQFTDSLMGGQGVPGSRPELHDSTYFANELKHVREYFDGASLNELHIVFSVTGKIYDLPNPMGYYGDDDFEDVRGVEMMQSVIDSADTDVDFSLYDTFMLIHAGAGQETDLFDNSRGQIYSTFFDRPDIDAAFPDSSVAGLLTNDMKDGMPFLVDNFMIVPEDASQDERSIGSLGIWVFNVGSRLGLLPLFDSTPDGFADSRGVGDFDVMSYGLFAAEGYVPVFPSAFNRVLAGWVDPVTVETNASLRLRDINTAAPGDTSCVKIAITESEYFLVVNRVHDTNFDSLFTFADTDSSQIPDNNESLAGAEFDFYMTSFTNPYIRKPDPNLGGIVRRFYSTGSGVYIWHVDENVVRQMVDTGHLPNDFSSRKGVDLEEADGVQDLDGTADAFSFSSRDDSYRAGNNTEFGPDTKPASDSNSGTATGVRVFAISAPDSFMTCSVEISRPYAETRTRWPAAGRFQPPTAVDLDVSGPLEIVTLADSAGVFAFNADGTEFVDNTPGVIEPYIAVPGAAWIGPPAFGDIDGGGDEEIVAADASGVLYAWKGDGSEVTDGDGIPATVGVLYTGPGFAAPPMLVDIDADPEMEIAIVEHRGDSLAVSFVDASGASVQPADPAVQAMWPFVFRAQHCGPLAFGAVATPTRDSEGIVIAFVDTSASAYGIAVQPVRLRSGVAPYSDRRQIAARGVLPSAFPATSAPAIGDLNGDGFDEAVVTLADGRAVLLSPATPFDPSSSFTVGTVASEPTPPLEFLVLELRSTNPSAPAIGDVDGNGTMEIVIVDDDYFYVMENNGRLRTNWPRPKRATELGSYPELHFDRALVSPLIAEINGGPPVEILYPDIDGTVFGFDGGGTPTAGFPRLTAAEASASPTVADVAANGEMSFVSLGTLGLLQTIDAVSDTMLVNNTMVLSIQSLPGSSTQDKSFWTMYQANAARDGRVTESNPLKTSSSATEPNSFIVYPNPVRGTDVHARIVLNVSASVDVEIFNLEGEKAVSKKFIIANPGGVVGTPFDETIDVSHLVSGVYMMRLSVGGAGSEAYVKTFAILR